MTIEIRALGAADLAAAERLRRLAFGTLFGLADPLSFRADAELFGARLWAFPDGGLVAEEEGKILGVAMANHWGSLGLFGPLAIHPDYWKRGMARQLLAATMPVFTRWHNRLAGLFTFPERPSHIRLYQEFGFWPRYLTAIMAKPVGTPGTMADALSLAAHPSERATLLAECRKLTDSIYAGLDLTREAEAVVEKGLGDVIMIAKDSRIAAFAICHCGRGSEGGAASCYIKYGQLRSGPEAPALLARLLAACNDFAQRRGASQLSLGVNLGRMAAYRSLIDLGFRTTLEGVAMHRPWSEAYDRPEVFAFDDWR